MTNKEKLKLYNKEKLIDIIEKLSVEFAIKNQQYEYIRHNDYSNELQQRIDKAIEYIQENKCYWEEWHYDGADIDIESDINYIYNILRGEDK